MRGLFVFAAARGDLRPEPGLGHCFLGPAALPASAVLGSRPFPACSGLSDGGECGESGGIQEPPQVPDPAGNFAAGDGSLWGLGVGGSQGRWVTGTGLRVEQAWEHEAPHVDIPFQASCWSLVSLIRNLPH